MKGTNMAIDEEIIKRYLFVRFPDLSESEINRMFKEMDEAQDKIDKGFVEFVDRLF